MGTGTQLWNGQAFGVGKLDVALNRYPFRSVVYPWDCPVGAVQATLAMMAKLSIEDCTSFAVTKVSRGILERWSRLGDLATFKTLCNEMYVWIRRNQIYVPDEEQVSQQGIPRELLIAPKVFLEHKKGDCDDFSMLACSLLLSMGIRTPIKFCAVGTMQMGLFNHVYLKAYDIQTRRWITMDCSHGQYVDWEVPRDEILTLEELRIC